MNEAELNQKLKEQNELLKAILKQGEKTKKYLFWLRVFGIIKLIIIITPIVLGVIYLPPFIERAIENYRNLLPEINRVISPPQG